MITKSGMKKGDEDQEHMIFLVGASNIFVGQSAKSWWEPYPIQEIKLKNKMVFSNRAV